MHDNLDWCTMLGWIADTPDCFSAGLHTPQGRCRLIVERLPNGRWEWLVWGPSPHLPAGMYDLDRTNAQRVQGEADIAAHGMIAAEHALGMLGVGPLPGGGQQRYQGLQSALETIS